MTTRHFIALAEYLRDTTGYCEPFSPKQIEHLANFCHSQNFKFKKDRWVGYIATGLVEQAERNYGHR